MSRIHADYTRSILISVMPTPEGLPQLCLYHLVRGVGKEVTIGPVVVGYENF